MNRIAAMQARSGTVRGAPPRAWEGRGGSSGWMRCHKGSGSSRSARVVIGRGSSHAARSPAPIPQLRFRNVLLLSFTNRGDTAWRP
jgi:hypothetical protein